MRRLDNLKGNQSLNIASTCLVGVRKPSGGKTKGLPQKHWYLDIPPRLMNKDHKRTERKLALREKNLASNLQIRNACPVEVVVSGHGNLSSANNFRAPGRRGWTHELKVLFPWALHLVTNMPCWGKSTFFGAKSSLLYGKKVPDQPQWQLCHQDTGCGDLAYWVLQQPTGWLHMSRNIWVS